jgi:hypothetical protein
LIIKIKIFAEIIQASIDINKMILNKKINSNLIPFKKILLQTMQYKIYLFKILIENKVSPINNQVISPKLFLYNNKIPFLINKIKILKEQITQITIIAYTYTGLTSFKIIQLILIITTMTKLSKNIFLITNKTSSL